MIPDRGKLLSIGCTLLHTPVLRQVLGPKVRLGINEAAGLLDASKRDPTGGRGDGSVSTLRGNGDHRTVGRFESRDVVLRSRTGAGGLVGSVSPYKRDIQLRDG